MVNNSKRHDSKKLMPRWSGPFIVVERHPPVLLRLRNCTNHKLMDTLVNIRCVKPYLGPTSMPPDPPPPLFYDGLSDQAVSFLHPSIEPIHLTSYIIHLRKN